MPSSFCRWQWSPVCLRMEETAVTLWRFYPSFFVWTGCHLHLSKKKSLSSYLYSKKCRWGINIFFDVAGSVPRIFVSMVVDVESVLVWEVAKNHPVCSYKWDRDSRLISSASYSCFLESRHSQAHVGPDSNSLLNCSAANVRSCVRRHLE